VCCGGGLEVRTFGDQYRDVSGLNAIASRSGQQRQRIGMIHFGSRCFPQNPWQRLGKLDDSKTDGDRVRQVF